MPRSSTARSTGGRWPRSASRSWTGRSRERVAALAADHARAAAPGRAVARAGSNVQRAIAAQPRLEVRLALLLWHLAARWGKVEPGGVRLPLPLTHQLLGRLVGAERPSVSHALARLAHAGLVTGHGDEWHLHGSVEEHLASMIEPPSEPCRQLVGRRSWSRAVDERGTGLATGRALRRAPARPRSLAHERTRLRRRLGRDDRRDQPEPGGPAPRRAARGPRGSRSTTRCWRTRAGSEFMRPFGAPAAGASIRSSSCSRAPCRTSSSAATATGRTRRRPAHRPTDHTLHVDRSPRSACRGGARARHLRRVRRHPRDARQPHRRDGAARLPRPRMDLARGLPIVNLPGCPVQPDSITETLLHLALHIAGRRADDRARRAGPPARGCSSARCRRGAGAPASPRTGSSRRRRPTTEAAW